MQHSGMVSRNRQSPLDVVYVTPNTVLTKYPLTQWTQESLQPTVTVTSVKLAAKSPVEVVGNEMDINPSLLKEGGWHKYTFKGKKYVIHKPKEGIIEIYKVK